MRLDSAFSTRISRESSILKYHFCCINFHSTPFHQVTKFTLTHHRWKFLEIFATEYHETFWTTRAISALHPIAIAIVQSERNEFILIVRRSWLMFSIPILCIRFNDIIKLLNGKRSGKYESESVAQSSVCVPWCVNMKREKKTLYQRR